jgi:hypothetical protein
VQEQAQGPVQAPVPVQVLGQVCLTVVPAVFLVESCRDSSDELADQIDCWVLELVLD